MRRIAVKVKLKKKNRRNGRTKNKKKQPDNDHLRNQMREMTVGGQVGEWEISSHQVGKKTQTR